MRRLRLGLLIAGMVVGTAAGAVGATSEPTPSLEYKPPREVVPEPKAPHPLPPMVMFREVIGSFGMLTGSFDRPVNVVADPTDPVDPEGAFFVIDAGNNRIQKFRYGGTVVGACGVRGINTGQFDNPGALAIGTGPYRNNLGLYVVDTGNNRIQLCNPDFKGTKEICECVDHRPWPWGSRGSSRLRADFKSPREIVFDTDGNTYVLDSGNDRVMIFSAPGDLSPSSLWDSSTNVTGGAFSNLTSIAWSDERLGYIYLLGKGCVVQQFQRDRQKGEIRGVLVNTWSALPPESGLCEPAQIRVDQKNHFVYVLDSGNNQVSSYNHDGLYRWTLQQAQTRFSKPLGFWMDGDGEKFLLADTDNNVVQKFTLR